MENTTTPEEQLARNIAKDHRMRSYRRIVCAVLALSAISALFAISVWASLLVDSAISVRGLL